MNELSTPSSENPVPHYEGMSQKLIRITRLKQFATQRGLEGPVALGAAIGKKANQVSDLLSGTKSFGEKVARSIEEFAGLPTTWLDHFDDGTDVGNTQAGPDIRGKIPLISLVQAGKWSEIVESFQPGDAADWLACPFKHGEHTFCLTVKGESMFNPDGKPSYSEGDIIAVDPSRAALSGDRIVVRLDDQNEATFKQYMEEDGRKLLKALNPEWKPRYTEINGNATICGVVIGKWVPE